MTDGNIASVSWGDHLMFGEGDGRLDTEDALARRIDRWRDELGAGVLYWRCVRLDISENFITADGRPHPYEVRCRGAGIDEIDAVPRLAHGAGLDAFLYVTLFDEGWPLPPPEVRAVSYHNDMHCQHVSWQTGFCRDHPDYMVTDRNGETRQWAVTCFAYEEAREHFRERFLSLVADSAFDGLFVCLRSQSRPPDFADQFGFNEPVRRDYRAKCGRGIDDGEFDAPAWRSLLGGYLTTFLSELREALSGLGFKLAVGAARGDVLGPPLGNVALQWREWVGRGLVDHLVINQNSSRCPSMWHDLWPMHRGDGYLLNYLDPASLPPLARHIDDIYGPVVENAKTTLYVARQWDPRDEAAEAALLDLPAAAGLVFSTFRHDNPGPLARGDWRY